MTKVLKSGKIIIDYFKFNMDKPKSSGFQGISFIINKKVEKVFGPAYQWQDTALRIIKELAIPNFKRSSVFKVCKDNSKEYIERCLNDTKELCQTGDRWKYFFKVVVGDKNKPEEPPKV